MLFFMALEMMLFDFYPKIIKGKPATYTKPSIAVEN